MELEDEIALAELDEEGVRQMTSMTSIERVLLCAAVLVAAGCGQRRSAANPLDPAGDKTGDRNGRVLCARGEVPGNSELISYAADGSDPRRLGVGFYPAWSRDGTQIWYSSRSLNGVEIWTMAADGSNPRQISTMGGVAITAALSPDGRSVAFTGLRPGADHSEIWVMDTDGTGLRQLTTTTGRGVSRTGATIYQSVHPSWSADGKKLVYASSQSGSIEVWAMNSDGTAPTQLTFAVGDRYPDSNVPEFSRDGTRITFWSGYETEYGEVWVMGPDGGNRRRVTDTAEQRNSDDPTWSPDGKSLIFISNPRGGPGVGSAWLVSAAGGEPQLFASGATYCAWQPIP